MSDSEEKTTTVDVEETKNAETTQAAEEAAKKAAEEEAARVAAEKAAEEEAARVAAEKAAEEEAARVAAEKAAEEKELEEQMAELKRLQELNNAQWKLGEETNFQNMTHTENGMKKTERYQRARVVQGFMHNLTHTTQYNTSTVRGPKTNHKNTIRQRGMMFGGLR